MKMTLIKDIGAKAGKLACRTGLKIKKYSPELLLAGGIVCGISAVVTACIATKKLCDENVIGKASKELDEIQKQAEIDIQNYDKTDVLRVKKQKGFKVCKKLVYKLIQLYGLTAILILLAMGFTLGSHGIMKKRYISTALAYKTLDEAFKDYRKRVKDGVGEEKELHFFNGTEERGETTRINENGDSVTEKDITKVYDKKYTPYEFDWNATTAPGNWEANSDYNFMFLKGIQNYANDLLQSRGHVFLNEVLDAVGLARTHEGAAMGWLLGSGGDDYIDFGISEYYTDEYSDVFDGKYLKNIHLNFNCDGVIWDRF